MKKINSIWSGFALTFLTISAAGQEVKISMDHPDQVNAGQAFEVKVTINKGNLTDYSRFSQDLPLGLTATNVNSPNADFSFDTQRIRIIWLKLPEEPEVSVIYSIQVDERLKGKFVLGGVFAYVVEEERKFLNFEKSKEITILPNPNVDPALVVDIKDFKGGAAVVPLIVEDVEEEPYAMAIRQKPVLLPSGGYMIRLLVQNPSGSKYAKIEETIPSGYLFESVDPHDGIESFASSTVKFIWMKLPSEPEFEVAYRLVPKRDEPQGAMAIEGVLTYSVGNENKIVDVKEVDVALETLSPDQKRTLLLTGAVPAGAKKATETAARVQPEPVAKETVKAPVTTVEPVPTTERTILNTRVLQAGSGIIFRVQLSANRKAFDARNFFRKAGVDQEVFVEEHGGLYKYTAGSYTNYSQAQAYRDKLEALSQVSGAFVVAYQNGKRVPVSTVR